MPINYISKPTLFCRLPHVSVECLTSPHRGMGSDSEPEEGADLGAMNKKEFRLHMKKQKKNQDGDGEGGAGGGKLAYGDQRKWKKVDVGDMVMGGEEGGTC